MCKDTQKSGSQGTYAKLEAAPKDFIALQYLENGHVTKPTGPRPFGNGTVYVYGTKTPSDSFTFNAIHKKWNIDGTGGDKKGKLIATRYYDDGQCYQMNPSEPISVGRSNKSGVKSEVPCQTDVQLPEDAGTSGDYTLYWVWDYALMGGDSGKQANNELYTACMDISMTSQPASDTGAAANDILNRAIPKQMKNLFLANPTSEASTSPAPFDGAKPAVPNQGVQPPVQGPVTVPVPANGPVTVTVTQVPVSTVYVTRDGAAPAASSIAGAPVPKGPPGVPSAAPSVPTGGVYVTGGPGRASPPPSTLLTVVQPTGAPTGRPSVIPFTMNPANAAPSAAARPAGRFRRANA
ncbi:hypothetical protein M7I_1793 [Glarea lozoyensis 74030]|uniref:DUF7492 domain-containing protein n=1 Tax=Glarea lozoyensis (strain ATCC 74030 / MF5533) TaxID=1104152 RepID=H0EH58_GLAL7|nr:hypothetical protein M7I_1793 [Glarea lozoyensis 74030]